MMLCIALELQPWPLFALHLRPGGKWGFTTGSIVDATLQFGGPCAIVVAALSASLWWALGIFRVQSLPVALALGFSVTFTFYLLTFGASVGDSAIFGFVGLIAGLTTWLVSDQLRSGGSSASPA
jgi:hypothetical protein